MVLISWLDSTMSLIWVSTNGRMAMSACLLTISSALRRFSFSDSDVNTLSKNAFICVSSNGDSLRRVYFSGSSSSPRLILI